MMMRCYLGLFCISIWSLNTLWHLSSKASSIVLVTLSKTGSISLVCNWFLNWNFTLKYTLQVPGSFPNIYNYSTHIANVRQANIPGESCQFVTRYLNKGDSWTTAYNIYHISSCISQPLPSNKKTQMRIIHTFTVFGGSIETVDI